MAFIRSGGFRILLAAVAVLSFAIGAAGVGFYINFLRDLPDLHRIEDFRPALSSLVLDSRGVPIGEFYTERRSLAPLESIPEHTRLAFVAAEDSKFFEHAGIDYVAILRAAWVDLRAGRIEQGASTITMQLVKQMLLSPEKKFRRKFREMILARKIEANFSKDEILYLYLNQIYFGHGAWGIGQAARSYFGKEVGELSISESALLAGLPQRPSEYSPFRDPEAAEKRRRHVLKRLRGDEYIDEAQYAEALEDVPDLVGDIREEDYEAAGYFTEEVRRYLFELLGGKQVLEGGLVIETTLRLDLQKRAVESVRAGLRAHDRRQGYRGPLRRVTEENIAAEIELLAETNELVQLEPDEESLPPEEPSEEPLVAEADPLEPLEEALPPEEPPEEPLVAEADPLEPLEEALPPEVPLDRPLLGVVTSVDAKAKTAQVSFAPEVEGRVYLADVDWARQPNPKRRPTPVKKIGKILKTGDVTRFVRLGPGESKAPEEEKSPDAELGAGEGEEEEAPREEARLDLFQEPAVQGSLLAFEVGSGDVLALVGGKDYQASEFNRSTQAQRQPGSAFKPLIYGAALSRSYTPVSTIYDRPVVIKDEASGFVWRPRNYGRHFYGPMPLRRALAKSVNNATVHLFRDVGVDYVINYARRLGIRSPLSRDLTLALGSSGVTLLELTSAYAVFPNGGRRLVPRFIARVTDRNGDVLLTDVQLGIPPTPMTSPLTDDDEAEIETEMQAEIEAELPPYPDSEIPPTDRLISEQEAYLMCDLLKAVVQEGTGRGARKLGGYLGGKTGTTNDQADAWFMGFSPDVVTGVWVGYDQVQVLGWGETGAKAALPIWRDFMGAALAGYPVRDFEEPEGIEVVAIDRDTGLLADATTENAYFQPFLADTAPTETSSSIHSISDTRRALRDDAFQ
jgi:penicillin-binding protein 1A